MTDRPLVTDRPADRDVEQAAYRLATIIDDAVDALLLLQPDLAQHPAPASALRGAVHADPAYARAERRFRDVLVRVQEQVPEGLYEDFEELEQRVVEGMHDAAQVGWRLGLNVGRQGHGAMGE
jgi:hypothetical protein